MTPTAIVSDIFKNCKLDDSTTIEQLVETARFVTMRLTQQRGNAGPRGWQRLQRHDLDSSAVEMAEHARENTSI